MLSHQYVRTARSPEPAERERCVVEVVDLLLALELAARRHQPPIGLAVAVLIWGRSRIAGRVTCYSVCLARAPPRLTTSRPTPQLISEPLRSTHQMASRTSARASARPSSSRAQASSLSKQPNQRQSHSPSRRRTRITRSQSIDLDGSDSGLPASTGVRRSKRQASIESEGSVRNRTSESSRLSNRQRTTRGAELNEG
jgi:hypothetical protein